MPVAQPAFVFRNDGGAVTIRSDAEWIAPFAAAADIDGSGRHAGFMLVENPAHRSSPPDPSAAADWRPGAVRLRGSASPAGRCGNGWPVDPRNAAPRQVKPRRGSGCGLYSAAAGVVGDIAGAGELDGHGGTLNSPAPFARRFPDECIMRLHASARLTAYWSRTPSAVVRKAVTWTA
jgi:hypothetical protein